MISGIDLVEWQLRIAQGEPLPLQQGEIEAHGCAIEARLYAEDPAHSYLPSVGRIEHLRWPPLEENLRIDSGVDTGDEISSFYDPMLGKIIAWGGSRAAAIDTLRAAMSGIEIIGVTTNRALLGAILADEHFRAGSVATNFLGLRHAHLAFGEPAAAELDVQMAALWCATRRTDADALWDDSRGWRLGTPPTTRWRFDGGEACIAAHGHGRYAVLTPAGETPANVLSRHAGDMRVEFAGATQNAHIIEMDGRLHVFRGGRHVALRLQQTNDALKVVGAGEQGSLLTPLPGTVVAVHVSQGQTVTRGAALITVEAMKMEHTLTAPGAGVVSRVVFGLGERVSAGAVLVEVEPLPPPAASA
jgi:3-methylcrotonyl-CoA carboxylase alpha subunit